MAFASGQVPQVNGNASGGVAVENLEDNSLKKGPCEFWKQISKRVFITLVMSLILFPSLALVLTVFTYISPLWISNWAVVFGGSLAGIICVALTVICWPLFSVKRMNGCAYDKLVSRVCQLQERVVLAQVWLQSHDASSTQKSGLEEARINIAIALGQLELPTVHPEFDSTCYARPGTGLRWLLATGYGSLWERIYTVEEALLLIEPTPQVLHEALHDEWRLNSSPMDKRDELLASLKQVCETLRHLSLRNPAWPPLPGSSDTEHQRERDQTARKTLRHIRRNLPTLRSEQQSTPAMNEHEARVTLRHIRRSLNTFRSERWNGLIHARNRLVGTGTFTCLFVYLLLCLALICGANRTAIIAAAVFFLVGALVGLFDRLQAESDGTATHQFKQSEDYGLTAARLIYVPLFSGLAAISGVVLVAMLPFIFNVDVVIPRESRAVPSSTTVISEEADGENPVQVAAPEPARSIILQEVFDLESNRFVLIIAAIFGLTPNLALNRLKQETDKYKGDLNATKAIKS